MRGLNVVAAFFLTYFILSFIYTFLFKKIYWPVLSVVLTSFLFAVPFLVNWGVYELKYTYNWYAPIWFDDLNDRVTQNTEIIDLESLEALQSTLSDKNKVVGADLYFFGIEDYTNTLVTPSASPERRHRAFFSNMKSFLEEHAKAKISDSMLDAMIYIAFSYSNVNVLATRSHILEDKRQRTKRSLSHGDADLDDLPEYDDLTDRYLVDRSGAFSHKKIKNIFKNYIGKSGDCYLYSDVSAKNYMMIVDVGEENVGLLKFHHTWEDTFEERACVMSLIDLMVR